MPRTHYTAADLERLSCNVKDVQTIITFRNEQLLNLFINEMQGQISDGMWENSRHTDWLWKHVIYRLGDETKVQVLSSWNIGKKSYPLAKELWDCVGYRMWGEQDETTAGYRTEKEVREAWRELNLAIYNATELPREDEIRKLKNEAYISHQNTVRELSHQAEAEKANVLGGENRYYAYLDEENHKGAMFVDCKVVNNEKGGYYYFVVNKCFKVEAGKLAEAFDEIRDLYFNSKNFKLLSVY